MMFPVSGDSQQFSTVQAWAESTFRSKNLPIRKWRSAPKDIPDVDPRVLSGFFIDRPDLEYEIL